MEQSGYVFRPSGLARIETLIMPAIVHQCSLVFANVRQSFLRAMN